MNTSSSMSEQLLEAGSLLAVGMSSVFIFLSVLIVSVKLIAKFVEAFPEPEATTYPAARRAPTSNSAATSAASAQGASSATNQQDVITAITHAVTAYRQGKQPPSK